MPTFNSQEELIQAFREEYPDLNRRSDEQIYNMWAN